MFSKPKDQLRLLAYLLAGIGVWGLASCASQPPELEVHLTLEPKGGALQWEEVLSVQFQPNTVAQNTTITARYSTQQPAIAGAPFEGASFRGSLTFGPSGSKFAKPFAVGLRLNAETAPHSMLPVYLRDPKSQKLSRATLSNGSPLFATVGPQGRYAMFVVDHFSQYLLYDTPQVAGHKSNYFAVKEYREVEHQGARFRIYFPPSVEPGLVFQSFGFPLFQSSQGLDDFNYRKKRYKEVLRALFVQSDLPSAQAQALHRDLSGLVQSHKDPISGLQVVALNRDFLRLYRTHIRQWSKYATLKNTYARFDKWVGTLEGLMDGVNGALAVGKDAYDIYLYMALLDAALEDRFAAFDQSIQKAQLYWKDAGPGLADIWNDPAFSRGYDEVKRELRADQQSREQAILKAILRGETVKAGLSFGAGVLVKWAAQQLFGKTAKANALAFALTISYDIYSQDVAGARRTTANEVLMYNLEIQLFSRLTLGHQSPAPDQLLYHQLNAYLLYMFFASSEASLKGLDLSWFSTGLMSLLDYFWPEGQKLRAEKAHYAQAVKDDMAAQYEQLSEALAKDAKAVPPTPPAPTPQVCTKHAPNLNHGAYSSPQNPFGRYGLECTRYAWGRVKEVTGISLTFSRSYDRHGGQWVDLLPDYPKGQTPQAPAIASFKFGSYGHVVYIECVEDGKVTFSQANVHEKQQYNGMKTLSFADFKAYMPGFQGFRYLKGQAPPPAGACPHGDGDYCGDKDGNHGQWLYTCSGGAYRLKERCSRGCQDMGPKNHDICKKGCACVAGSKRCSGARLETCKADCSSWDSIPCPNGCSNDQCASCACTPHTKRCEGSTLKTCKTDCSGWASTSCRRGCSKDQCIGNRAPLAPQLQMPSSARVGQAVAASVTAGTDPDGDLVKVHCTGDDRFTQANPYRSPLGNGGRSLPLSLTWSTPGAKSLYCVTFDANGAASPGATATITLQSCACSPASKRCSGARLETCKADCSGWDSISCPNGCNNNQCLSCSCSPGQKRCSGNYVETCKTDCSGWSRTHCPNGCSNNQCLSCTCSPGQKRCNGARLETCKADCSGWDSISCPQGCSNNQCVSCTCSPGQKRCNGSYAETCKADCSGWSRTHCSNGCSNGSCRSCTCTPGSRRCAGAYAQTCRSDCMGWSQSLCGCGCSSGTCTSQVCNPGSRRCNGSAVETCASSGCIWSRTQSCSSGCHNGTCTTPRPSYTIDGCTGGSYDRYCRTTNCYGCKPQGGFSATNATGCSGLSCFDRFPNHGYSGFVVMYARSTQSAFAAWQFPQSLNGNYEIYADIPSNSGLPAPTGCSRWNLVSNARYHLKKGSNTLQSKLVSHASSRGSSVLLFRGSFSGVTAITIGNVASPTSCGHILLDRIRAVPY